MQATIVYFSVSGKNERLAQAISRELDSRDVTVDSVKLMPKKKTGAVMGALMAAFRRPADLETYPELGDGELLVLVGPVWASTMSPAMRTFVTSLPNLGGRRVINVVCGYHPHERVVERINRELRARGAGPIVSRAVRVSAFENPDYVTEIAADLCTKALE